ncbi:MAG: hypothetical protein LBG97_08365 [Coriobacteriales bacterium]|nr:hypothetical protein [Coriobacteriales bacterium]
MEANKVLLEERLSLTDTRTRKTANTLEQDNSAAASTDADNSAVTENTAASELDVSNANDGADANTYKE